MRLMPLLALLVFVAGCPASASSDQLQRRASFDLGCNASQLRYVRIDDLTVGATGCGKRATYVESCDGPRMQSTTTCTWVLNGRIESAAPAAPAPPPAAASPPSAAPGAAM